MLDKNQKSEYVEIIVTCILFIVGCAFGKLGIEYFGESIWAFNIPAISIFVLGELVLYAIKGIISRLSSIEEDKSERAASSDMRNESKNGVVI